jgi:hypothetical protein
MFYCSALRQFFSVVVYNAEHFSALSPTTQKNVPRCCLQCQSFFCVVGNNAENCSNLSSCVFFWVVAHNADHFSALGTTAQKNYLRWCLPHGKMVSVVDNNAETCSNSIISTNLKPNVNWNYNLNQGPRLMCFVKKSCCEKSRGTVPLSLGCSLTPVHPCLLYTVPKSVQISE